MQLYRSGAAIGLATILFSTSHAANQILTVGPTGSGAQYSSLQLGVDAATDGDILLVEPGNYGQTTVNGKGLTIIADDPTGTEFFKIVSLTITNVSAPRSVVVRGFRLIDATLLTTRLAITHCSGVIAIEDCQLENGFDAVLQVVNSTAVTITRCTVNGATGNSMAQRDGSSAVRASNSSLALYDCALEGGRGGDDFTNNQLYAGMPTDGGPGLEIGSGSSVLVYGSIVSGGDGGNKVLALGDFNQCGDGGDAIVLSAAATLRRLNSPLIPGSGGISFWPAGIPGQSGIPLENAGGTVIVKNELARKFTASTPVREGETQILSIRGQPNESCWLLFSLAPQSNYFSGLQGTLLPAFPVTLITLPPLDPSGALDLAAPIPTNIFPPGVSAIAIYEQPMFIGASAPILLGSPSVTVLVDDTY